MYSLETLSEAKGIEQSDEKIDIEEQIIEQETIAKRNERLYAAVHKLSPHQQAIIQKVYFEEKSQREVSKELGVTESAISIQLARAIEKMKKFLEK